MKVEKRINEIVNRLNKTKTEDHPDFRQLREERDREERENQKKKMAEQRKKEKEAEDLKKREAETRLLHSTYSLLILKTKYCKHITFGCILCGFH